MMFLLLKGTVQVILPLEEGPIIIDKLDKRTLININNIFLEKYRGVVNFVCQTNCEVMQIHLHKLLELSFQYTELANSIFKHKTKVLQQILHLEKKQPKVPQFIPIDYSINFNLEMLERGLGYKAKLKELRLVHKLKQVCVKILIQNRKEACDKETP